MNGVIWSTMRKRMFGFLPAGGAAWAEAAAGAGFPATAATAGSCIKVRLVMGR
jgi:hypothetical protein